MKDILHPLCLIIAGSGFLLLLRDLRKGPRDPALKALAFTYFFSALSYAISLTPVWVRIDSTFGIPNVAVPLAQSCVILVFALQATVLAYWTKEPAAAARRAKFLFSIGVIVITGMVILFAMLTPVATRPVDFSLYYAHDPAFQAYLLLYMCTYTVAEIYLARVCWKYAREVGDPWIGRGLRLIAVGAVTTLGYSGIRLSAILGAELGFSVAPLEPYAWICGDIGATLTQVGYFMPIIAARITAALGWRHEHSRYERLQPLWKAVSDAEPSIVLMAPTDTASARRERRPISFELYRRSVEIRDGQIELRPYLDPAARTDAERRRRTWWRSSARTIAAVTADQIHAALVQKQHGTVAEPTTYADAALNTPTTSKDLRHLVRVAAYFTPPPAEVKSVAGART
ncbi:MAB_1171c family putative transporter [Streptomyces scopuliridis]|uniref:MAB_1171c family putative transporter n=1 Tax=Streptomyces scopuliridis TaxID=452529 RepID=UPI0036C22AC7